VAVILTADDLPLEISDRASLEIARVPLGDRFLRLLAYGEALDTLARLTLTNAFAETRNAPGRPELPPGGRLLLYGFYDDGSRFIVELNAHRPTPDPVLLQLA
jgi:hypothetical protein